MVILFDLVYFYLLYVLLKHCRSKKMDVYEKRTKQNFLVFSEIEFYSSVF